LDLRLRRKGIPAFTFGEVLHEALPRGRFPDAEHLALNLVQLPIHQTVTRRQLDTMATALRSVVEES
jgi:dTDP-4-amino-4,6-dideoxygalactose transaminase